MSEIYKEIVFLVTGGGTGLGKEMSEHYVQHGAEVVICGRRESVLADTAAEFKDKYDATVRFQPLDIRSPQEAGLKVLQESRETCEAMKDEFDRRRKFLLGK